ncbi:hypothetical protein BB559_003178 [Furculomyces boomerangus]|uniref:Bromo domain-containing protein n=2 Tax=Harpellales TaxID=61421 RepID=A0A2T9YN00_9FUNG|nr:hypothetical protein BB559_003178 [Furculomyces boomerangus]PWA00854.1 hypothetical protein BB558_003085 [Smittium angustum]
MSSLQEIPNTTTQVPDDIIPTSQALDDSISPPKASDDITSHQPQPSSNPSITTPIQDPPPQTHTDTVNVPSSKPTTDPQPQNSSTELSSEKPETNQPSLTEDLPDQKLDSKLDASAPNTQDQNISVSQENILPSLQSSSSQLAQESNTKNNTVPTEKKRKPESPYHHLAEIDAKKNKLQTLSPSQKSPLTKIINSLLQHKDAGPFSQPVDVVALNIPDYPSVVKTPMDLGTVASKLQNDEYRSVEDFGADINLIATNCFLYNGDDSPISAMARNIQKQYSTLLKKYQSSIASPEIATSDPATQLKLCGSIIRELFKKQYYDIAFYFYEPVDYVALNIPNYPKIIKQPMDLGTINSNITQNKYSNALEFYNDVKLVFQNCYKFNPKKHPVHVAGKQLESLFDRKWNEMFPSNTSAPHDSTPAKRPRKSIVGDGSHSTSTHIDSRNGSSDRFDSLATTKTPSSKKTDGSSISKSKSKTKSITEPTNTTTPEGDLTLQEKRQLSRVIETLPPERLMVAFEIIQSGYPEVIEQKEEIELDIDVLDFKTLRKLYQYVVHEKL